MKKVILAAAFLVCMAELFAYNPPYGGEDLYRLSNPELMSGAASAAGGPNFTIVPASITYNPALTAGEQRADINFSGTVFYNFDKIKIEGESSDKSVGGGFQAGMIVPTKWSVFSLTANALFADFYGMDLRKTLVFHAGLSKEVNEKLSVGANTYAGLYMGSGSDFSVGIDLGALYKMNSFSIFTNPRFGVSLLNIGKSADYETLGIDDKKDSSSYPSPFTPRVSFASTVFEVKKWAGSFSTDFAFPFFQNCVMDLGLGFEYNKFIRLSLGWQANIREIVEGNADGVNSISVGVSLKLGITSKKFSETNADWEKSEVTPSIATQTLYSGIQAVSFGARLDLGLKDTDAPEIILWNEE
ncbi:hypothetical protein [uncultured Treponema sp.]|uniref:hypothetical protein n=1 Tax=uncultured Treponema sp. TaxID=162155 RepID=UPI0025FB73B5|nr:hypothetical protein [uncultured Treponema sp.]